MSPPSEEERIVGLKGKAGRHGSITRADVLHAGRRAFLAEERLDVVALASDLGIARATVYRWFGDKERFIGEVLLSLAIDTAEIALARRHGSGARLVANVMTESLGEVMNNPAMKAFLASDPHRALRILTGPGSVVHDGLTAWVTTLLENECPEAAGDGVGLEDVSYALNRLSEAFCYAEITTGRRSELHRVYPLYLRTLGG